MRGDCPGYVGEDFGLPEMASEPGVPVVPVSEPEDEPDDEDDAGDNDEDDSQPDADDQPVGDF